ncbi:hypothetical protein FB451DRAFT_1434636 [Mycena latifolia]|nr:hypothetical protein FB451DRAFT_1434636 [Mycena latifolia]
MHQHRGTQPEEKKNARPRRPSSRSSRCPPRPRASPSPPPPRAAALPPPAPYADIALAADCAPHLVRGGARRLPRGHLRVRRERERLRAHRSLAVLTRPLRACGHKLEARRYASTRRCSTTPRLWIRAAARRREAGEGVQTAEAGGVRHNGGLAGTSTGRRRRRRVGSGLEASGGALLVRMSSPAGMTMRFSDFVSEMHYTVSGNETWA